MAALSLSAQDMSPAMAKYADGCFLLREAIAQNNFGKLIDAKVKFYGLKLDQFSDADFAPIDSASNQALLDPTIIFTPQFASKLVKEGVITISNKEDMHIMRKGDGELFLWHASIKPHTVATFKTVGCETCELFLCSTAEANLSLSVNAESVGTINGTSIKDNSAWYVNWNMPSEPEEFTFTISNNGEENATFVIAIN